MRGTMRRGIYETEWGNAAFVAGPTSRTAWDLDMQERIPIEAVTLKWIRCAQPGDAPRTRRTMSIDSLL